MKANDILKKSIDERMKAAKNLYTPTEVLVLLANDKSASIHAAVARNPMTPIEVLVSLAKDKYFVRAAVASNPITSVEVLTSLANDEDYIVRKAVARNPMTPIEVFAILSKDNNSYVRRAVAQNYMTPVEILSLLAKDNDFSVRVGVANNLMTPIEILSSLLNSDNLYVYKSAKITLKYLSTPVPEFEGKVNIKSFDFIITEKFVAIEETTNFWYKFKSVKGNFYVCGCFRGNRAQLVCRILEDCVKHKPIERMRILKALDLKFEEVFGK